MKNIFQPFYPAHHQLKLSLITLLCMILPLESLCAQAETLKDPTQPPALLYGEADNSLEVATKPVLQSVMIGPQLHAAIINGKTVMLGQKYEQATLIKLDAHKAVLRNPDKTTQTLLMDYAIDKKILSPAAISSAPKIKSKQFSKPIVVSEK